MNATADERLIVMLEARISEFEKRMGQAERRGTRTYQGLQRNSTRATRAMEQDMVRSTGRINQALASTSARIGTFGRSLIAGAVATGTAMVTRNLRQTVRDIAAVGDEARRAGLGVEEFQQWAYVANQNRIAVDALVDGFKELNLRADEWIATGGGAAAEAFTRLGFSAQDLRRRLEDPSELMLEIFRRMETLDRAAQIRVFDEILGGTGGERFVELLAQGEAGLRRTMATAQEVGAVMDEGVIQRAAEIDRQFNAIAATIETRIKRAVIGWSRILQDVGDLLTTDDAERGLTALVGEARSLQAVMEILREAARGIGDEGLLATFDGIAYSVRMSSDAFNDGAIQAEGYGDILDAIVTQAEEALAASNGIDEVSLDNARIVVAGLRDLLAELQRQADTTAESVGEALGMTTGTPLENVVLPQDMLGGRRSRAPRRAPNEGELSGDRSGGSSGSGTREGYAAAAAEIRARTEALTIEAAALVAAAVAGEDYGDAIEYARQRAELMLAAQQEGRELTPALQAEIDQLARAYVQAGNAAERSAEQLREVEAQAGRGAERMVDLFGQMAQGGDVAKRAVLDLIAELLRMSAIEGLTGLAKSGGGGFLGSIVRFLGFAEGGYTGDGGTHEPKGVVHGGEYVFSKRAVQALGVARLERMHQAAKGYASGGYVGTAPAAAAAPQVSGKIELALSRDLEARLLDEAAKNAVTITRKGLEQADRTLPDRLAQIQRNPRSR
ncbi:hypothetical protein [Pararhodobacter aggregans]|uniref:Uncharacterized protein n=1 Tax=Pararhodobacter aggregans TaxID=404875 RepID=A0A2T7UQL8_9RHOB|nr:hypothetical protein [Pararhodobacter aggregans]PTX01838.1 lambda family phage tail tape measure protein [Pararhodobacter aggregans]PVE47035.1 hypothetical protein DDE23_12310 [Pararhodobacter aggregans]